MTERHGGPGLWARQSRIDTPLLVLIAVVVMVASFLLTAGPLAAAAVATAELRSSVADFDATRRDLTGTATFGDPLGDGRAPSVENLFEGIEAALDAAAFSRPLADLLADPQWAVRTKEIAVDVGDTTASTRMRLATTDDWLTRVEIVAGAGPEAFVGTDEPEAGVSGSVPVAVSEDVAEVYGVDVGDVIGAFPVALEVSGVYAVDDPADPFWGHLPSAVTPAERRDLDGRRIVAADVYIDPASVASLRETFSAGALEFWYPLDVGRLQFAQAPELATQIRQAAAVTTTIALPVSGAVTVNAALGEDLGIIGARVNAASAVLALVAAGPLGVMLAVIALAVRSVLDRRASALSLVRARGAAPTSLRAGFVVEGALVAVPSALVGLVVAAMTVGGGMPPLWPALVVAAAVPLLLAAGTPSRRDGTARWVAEVLVAGLAAVSVFLLVRRGPVPAGVGIDPLLAAAPLLVAAAVSVGALRLYPFLMRAVQRAAHARRGPVAVVGSARAVRAPALGFAAAFALVVGLSIATFSAALWVTLVEAFRVAATTRDATFGADDPLGEALLWVLGLGVLVPLVFCAGAVAIASVAAARARGDAVAVLGVLGYSAVQQRRLVRWEFAPVALLAAVAGSLLGIAEVLLLAPALGLPALVGRPVSSAPLALPTIAVIGVFALVIALAAWGATGAARRRSGAATLRMGVE